MKLQPTRKSFENYIRLGFEYASRKSFDKNSLLALKKISLIDDAVLIVDDIIDNSKTRNGKPCMYLQEGIQSAIIQAELNKVQAIENLIKVMKISKTKDSFQKIVLEKIFEFFKNIYLGEKLDLELDKSKKSHKTILKKYDLMIKLFTGGHIKFGLEIGQLIANKNPEENLSKISEHAGIIRQIVDDYNDYFEEHHEPFGDFINELNRFPEIIFKKQKGNRSQAIKLIEKKEYKKARDIILNEKARKEIFKKCQIEFNKIQKIKTEFQKEILIEDFNKIININ